MIRQTLTLILAAALIAAVAPPRANAIVRLSDRTINEAVRYGMENREMNRSMFLGNNWREGAHGTLLNIYTPYMELARSASKRMMTTNPTDEDIVQCRKRVKKDLDYIWHHPLVKFSVAMYGDEPGFARKYFAVIEGVARGRDVKLYPTTRIPQYTATKEEGVEVRPYTAINNYHFKFQDVAQLDEFVFRLYGDDVETISFKVINKDIR